MSNVLVRPRAKGQRRPAWEIWVLTSFGLLLILSIIRVLTDATDLTSSGTIEAGLAAAVPIGMAGLGGLWAERAGVVNIGLEGMMILGTWGCAFMTWKAGPWWGVLFGTFLGALGGLVHALMTVTFGVDHIISGVAIIIIAPGITLYLTKITFATAAGGGQKQSPPLDDVFHLTAPGSGLLGDLEAKHWFLLSDLAGIVRGLTLNVSAVTILAVLLVVGSALILWRTPFGLRVRSCGEHPHAAESLGVNVYRYKYYAVVISGALAGFAGAALALAAHQFRDGQTGGRGFIGLAAMIFGNWRPGSLAAGAGLFGYTDAIQLRSANAVHALLLLVAVALVLVAVWQWRSRQHAIAVAAAVIAGLSLLWYFGTDELPSELVGTTPYVITLLVLALASQRLRMPKADGKVYRKGELH